MADILVIPMNNFFEVMISWIKDHNYPMLNNDWIRLSKENGYPQYFTNFRKPLKEMLKEANEKCGFFI